MHRYSLLSALFVAVFFVFPVSSSSAQGLVINELMASNQRTIADEDVEFSDWIELFNGGAEPINLGGYALTDDPEIPVRWRLPDVTLDPDEHFFLFASGKDRRGGTGFWETVVDYGDSFRYYTGSSQPSFMWTFSSYDDATWDEGPSPLGYERDATGADIATAVPEGTVTLYLRVRFTIPADAQVVNAILHMDYDDAFIAYINGSAVARGNMPNDLSHGSPAATNHEAVIYSGGNPERFEIPDPAVRIRPGENVLAVRIHNVSSTSSDLTAIPFLTVAFADEVEGGTGPSDYLPADLDTRPHTNFKLDAGAEYLILSDTLGVVVDSVAFTALGADVSIGRKPDGSDEWLTFLEPTPGGANVTEGYAGDPLIAPQFSLPAGKYVQNTSVTLSSPEGAAVYYTTDGSPPTASSTRYTGPIQLSRTTVIRARALSAGRLPSLVATQTYLINENSTIPVISLSTDPPNLWDYETGIYADGPGWTPENPHFGANYWQEWEIPVHVEFFEPDGSRPIAQDAGTRIFGAWSRARPQKSFALFARNEYGPERFTHRIFAGRNYDSFVSLVLRNSGNDANQLHFIDAYMQALVHYTGMETLEYRPAHIFLNGEYWGILNLREKANEYFVADRHGLDPDSVDVLEMSGGTAVALEGSATPYYDLVSYLNTNDVTRDEVFAEVERRVDIDNFIDYQITQIYVANTDWPGNNHKFWRPQGPDGRFRWILYDTDFGFGSNNSYNHNTLAFATATNGPGWPNPPGSTFLLRTLLRNNTFRDRFINRFADHLNYTFQPARLEAIMDEMASVLEPEIQRHFSRWGGSMTGWRSKQTSMMTFGRQRTSYMWGLLRSFFSLDAPMEVTVSTSSPLHGQVLVNQHLPGSYPYAGDYFPGVSVRLEALPRPGYRFVQWAGSASSTERVITMDPLYGFNVTAMFEVDDSQPSPVTISEIQYHPSDEMTTGDWVELYNPMEFAVDISGWRFQDEDPTHEYELPSGTTIGPRGFLVVAEDPAAFTAAYPSVGAVIGGWEFALSNSGERIRLTSPSGEVIDEVDYSDDAPWPAAPDGTGRSLELAHLIDDNANPRYWESSAVRGGSPGALNSVTVPVGAEDAPDMPQQIALAAAYPNPFGQATTIPFALPTAGHVTLRVYNALGQLVETLVDDQVTAGVHEARWTPTGAASGVYFYEMRVDGVRRGTGKAVLVR